MLTRNQRERRVPHSLALVLVVYRSSANSGSRSRLAARCARYRSRTRPGRALPLGGRRGRAVQVEGARAQARELEQRDEHVRDVAGQEAEIARALVRVAAAEHHVRHQLVDAGHVEVHEAEIEQYEQLERVRRVRARIQQMERDCSAQPFGHVEEQVVQEKVVQS